MRYWWVNQNQTYKTEVPVRFLLVIFAAIAICSPSFSHAQTQFKSKEIGEIVLRLGNLKADLADAQTDLSNSIFSQPLGGGKLRIGEEIRCLRGMEDALGSMNITLSQHWTAHTIRDMLKNREDRKSATEITEVTLKYLSVDIERAETEINNSRRLCAESSIVNEWGIKASELLSDPALKSVISGSSSK
jgi:hypothetical protein